MNVTASQFLGASVSQRDPIEWRRNGDCRTHRKSYKTGNLQRPEHLQAAALHVTHNCVKMERSGVRSQKGRWPHSWANDRKRHHTRISDGHGSYCRALLSPTRFASPGFDFGHEPLSLNPLSSSHRYIATREGERGPEQAEITSAIGPRDDDNANITLQTCGLRSHAHAANAKETNQCNPNVLQLSCGAQHDSQLRCISAARI